MNIHLKYYEDYFHALEGKLSHMPKDAHRFKSSLLYAMLQVGQQLIDLNITVTRSKENSIRSTIYGKQKHIEQVRLRQ